MAVSVHSGKLLSMNELAMYLKIKKEHLDAAITKHESDRTINLPELLAYAESEAIEDFLGRYNALTR